jgi:4-hydroxy-3-methylbut-2-enyl diphosphate reductase
VPEEATRRGLFQIDATCPLVSKVHIEVARQHAQGREILLIGHAGHPEVIGTIGQLGQGTVRIIETVADAESFTPADAGRLAYVTQTTLSVDDTRAIIEILERRFPGISGPHKNDICYATSNRQEAVKAVAGSVDAMMVVGAPNSSNSKRLVEVARKAGCQLAFLVQTAEEIPWERLSNLRILGLSAGASAPEHLIEGIIAAFSKFYDVSVETVTTAHENVTFKLPQALSGGAA